MEIETAMKIVKEYGKILKEDPCKNIQGRFLSLLPYDKETMKEALKVNLEYVGTTVPKDEKTFRSLLLAFLQLASFITDDNVVLPFDISEALDSDDICHGYCQYLAKSEKVNNHISEQTRLLLEELEVFCQDNGLC